MPVRVSTRNMAAVAGVTLAAFSLSFFADAQASPIQDLLASQNGIIPASEHPPAGSVRPTIATEEQVQPCYAKDMAGARALVNVLGLDNEEGNIRVQIYSDDPEEFLANGKKLLRVDVPVSSLDMQVCVTFPKPGTYAMVVMHDRNANGRADILTEGFGFSRNPRLMFSKPDHDEVAFAVPEGVIEMDVSLNYMFRLENKERRRRKRR